MSMAKGGARGVQSVEIGGRLLTALVTSRGQMMLRNLASIAEIAPAQAHAYLSSYKRAELVSQDSATGRYQLGPLAVRLGIARINSYGPLSESRDVAVELERQLGTMVLLSVWAGGAPTVIQVRQGNYPLNINTRPGTTMAPTATATGKIFCAFSKDENIAIAQKAEQKATSISQNGQATKLQDFDKEITQIQKKGFAIADGSPVPTVCEIAAPIHNSEGRVLAVLSVLYPTDKIHNIKHQSLTPVLIGKCEQLSARFKSMLKSADE
jgi:DNA-binding IclR family transcriptional regulator